MLWNNAQLEIQAAASDPQMTLEAFETRVKQIIAAARARKLKTL